ncbi:hypothetical protein [Spirilliplanes yamanashiensis]|uniref:Uncharacterized protein n=1 Tax=Spirilliplanes yamanashiensis TaxID=42233 RepID=A0A8J3Y4Z4_9ACTN|nr:hypothetical protein [Spirilliplanes yamanashiensis]MDP9819344.1 hypothetical protein [Spirilliplanes yamanashiensis]GIJ01833.1 hypothetical protein Sya03_11850 [Spirilliplanes yamanashiensis]
MHPILVQEQLRLRHDDLLREAAAYRAGVHAGAPAGRHRRPRRAARTPRPGRGS